MISCGLINAEEKDQTAFIAKNIQCSYLREKSFLDIYELYAVEKKNIEYVKKVSDSIYAQAFKICDPENSANADKDIFTVCTAGCEQFVIKGLLGLSGPSATDVEKCKKMCLNYSDLLGINYSSATRALKKHLEMNLLVAKKIEVTEPPLTIQVIPEVPISTVLEKE